MIAREKKNDPFNWEYGVMYVIPERTGTNVVSYPSEEIRNINFEKAINSSVLTVYGREVPVRSVVKFKAESSTYVNDE